ncbi:hypothetical protein NKG94_25515 [Micromonospora sp. M12]
MPSNLSYTQSGTTISLNWVASTDNAGGSGIAGYDVYRNGAFLQSVGNVTTFNDTQPATATVSYYVRARDAAGNLSGNSNTVTRTGSGDTTAPSVPGRCRRARRAARSRSTGCLHRLRRQRPGRLQRLPGGNLIATLGTVLTYQDTQAATATVSYYVRARDGAGNLSGNSNTVTRTGSNPPACTNVAQGKSMTASGSTFSFTPDKANDGQLTTYWEGAASYPQNLTVALGANHSISSVTVRLNPDPSWAPVPRPSRSSAATRPRPRTPAWCRRRVTSSPRAPTW